MLDNCQCPWCGASGKAEEFDVSQDGKGFWCPDCDGFFYKNPDEDTRRMLLLLEDRQPLPYPANVPKTKLRKRLSPLRYPGGKSKVIDQIYARLDERRLDTFVEMFAGGASLGLSLLEAGKIQWLVLNDFDPVIFNFWRVVVTSPELLLARLKDSPTLSDFYEAQEAIKRDGAIAHLMPDAAMIDLAYSFLLVNRLSFGGLQMSGPICGKRGTTAELCQRWNPKMLKNRIESIASMADHIIVTRHDSAELLMNHTGWLPNNSTLFIDPPYFAAGPTLYREGFSNKHEELAALLNEFYVCWPGPDIVITYDDCQAVRALYPHATIEKLVTHWSISRN